MQLISTYVGEAPTFSSNCSGYVNGVKMNSRTSTTMRMKSECSGSAGHLTASLSIPESRLKSQYSLSDEVKLNTPIIAVKN